MNFEKNTFLQIGDWVKGKLMNGELLIGFVEDLDILEEQVTVTVAVSDIDQLAGQTIRLPLRAVEPAPATQTKDRGQLLFLIDLALVTGDKEWFDELSSELNNLKQSVAK
ncbi:IDEAL domain-containing protein [Indiicoccus explosivorum]|uniref:IDEAL domain-containing protein n=1 Tax=Indiicoccus explosivorum TaxID=1917864 RepID=UPI000B44C847|nr:IDEAL domain-containing protein [Indiicoccus explosivorum]